MPSTATTSLRLEKMAAGENDGLWGPKMTAVLDRLDEAIAGTTSINTTGGTETLTSNNFSADQSRSAILLVSGTLVSNVTVEIPAASKVYIVKNATTGNFSLTVQVSGGTGATVAQGSRALIMCDGTDCFNVGGTEGKHTIWIPASAMIPRLTNGPEPVSSETTTNKVMLRNLNFDTSTQEFAQFFVHMPKGWDEGTVTFQVSWSHSATTTNFGVAWALQGLAFSDDDALDAAFGTEIVVTDTGGTTGDLYITSESSAMTIGGTPAENDYVIFQIKRVPSNGSDNLAVDAGLHGVKLLINTNAATDD